MQSTSEENYLKVIYATVKSGKGLASTNDIAEKINTRASSVTDMLKKLSEKKLVDYRPYQGSTLTKEGEELALNIIRKHRLWEVFLVEKLKFKWDEVHVIAEQLEHVHSKELTNRLDSFLDFPKFDPHGDPIPDMDGNLHPVKEKLRLSELKKGEKGLLIGVVDSSSSLLRFLENQNLTLGTEFKVVEIIEYDGSYHINLGKHKEINLSNRIASNIWVKHIKSNGNN